MADMITMGLNSYKYRDEYKELKNSYRNSSGNVAFIDESYRPKSRFESKNFYLLTATIIEREKIDTFRDKLIEIAGERYWHSYDEAKTEAGCQRILKMSRYIARNSNNIISIKTEMGADDPHGEKSRRLCFEVLFLKLFETHIPKNGLIIAEKRHSSQHNFDLLTIKNMRSKGVLPRNALFHFGQPDYEQLLWAPDIVGWSTQRSLVSPKDDKSTRYLKELKKLNKISLLPA